MSFLSPYPVNHVTTLGCYLIRAKTGNLLTLTIKPNLSNDMCVTW